ncbi:MULTISPECIES: pirin family protein [unclassified Halomonas]|uniref:pirin family protein n=1 Tax=unclassified Halomonas TaxID=2609666 RepID=UPI0009905D21|nr:MULTISPECIES: pirin family protein [unclassified Halomonas]AQU81332.1 quercetin 2,3-dioxygenase [Halomonas sp. 'Soap Lake \
MKRLVSVTDAPRPHWVGDGFPARSLFSYGPRSEQLSPFLLLDYAGPADFTPTTRPRGVGQHPHRGFETVTIVYQGEVAHRDSTGKGGVIGPGDVQWMTAGAGILHEEFHSPTFTQTGGTLEMVQLWVNLPAKDKMAKPGYQAIFNAQIPVVDLPEQAGSVRVIAGDYIDNSLDDDNHMGPAQTFSPMNVWDVQLKGGKTAMLTQPEGWTTLVVVLKGTVQINGEEVLREAQVAELTRDGDTLTLEANNDATLLLLSGEPLNEPVVGHGPFVMNSEREIIEAIEDFNSGRFGQMPS